MRWTFLPVVVAMAAGLSGQGAGDDAALRAAGLHRLTISLDTLERETFRLLSRRDDLPRVLDGIAAAAEAGFTEASAWRDVGAGWQPIFGSFRGVGFSFEWHDFQTKREFDWAASFHPGCVELC